MSWTGVLRINTSGMPVSVSNGGEWGFMDGEGRWTALYVRPPPSLVSVLESEPHVFDALLRSRLAELHLDPQLVDHFPLGQAIRHHARRLVKRL